MRFPLLTRSAVILLAFAAACTQDRTPVTNPPKGPDDPDPPKVVGLYEVKLTGIGTDEMSGSVRALRDELPGGPGALAAVGSGLQLEAVSSSSFIDGTRAGGGQRYVTFTFRIRNGTGVALNNMVWLPVSRSSGPTTISGTPLSVFAKFDGTALPDSVARKVVPTGATALGSDFVTMHALYPDVLQVFTEAEIAALTPPANVTSIFPYGFVVRNKNSNANRTLPATADPNQWDGLFTIAFRVPLQLPNNQADLFSATFQFMAITDTETRLTESVEESQDTAAVRRLRDRATAMGATTVTVLNGSPAMSAAVPDYPGQRQICDFRTAGTAGAPLANNRQPGGYAKVEVLTLTETVDGCNAYFRGGTASRPATDVPFTVTVKAMDRYGNVKTAQADTVVLSETNGVPATFGSSVGLVSGSANLQVTYTDYGSSILLAQGKRLRGYQPIPVAGVVRTWTGAVSTNWHTGANWSPAAAPKAQDSVLVPLAAPVDPVLAANVTIRGVTVEDGATISLNAFDLTANANVSTGTTGGITNTSGRLFLSGTAATVQGVVPTLRVNGTYSLTGNVTARAPIQVDAGRLTVSGLRLQASSQ